MVSVSKSVNTNIPSDSCVCCCIAIEVPFIANTFIRTILPVYGMDYLHKMIIKQFVIMCSMY